MASVPSAALTASSRPDRRSTPEQVAFFHGCYVNYNHPQLGKDLIRVVNALGTGVQLLSRENAAACR